VASAEDRPVRLIKSAALILTAALRRKYRAERDRRLRPDGAARHPGHVFAISVGVALLGVLAAVPLKPVPLWTGLDAPSQPR
jgi:hypothetical protein